jgi:RNA recognition motif-containing protein
VRLYIGGLPPSLTPEDLAQRFKSFGDVKSAEVAPDKVYPSPRPGAKPMRFPRNFGFVSIVPKDEKSLERAMAAYNGSAWRGSTLRCKLATPSGPDYVAVEKLEDEEYAANPDVEVRI